MVRSWEKVREDTPFPRRPALEAGERTERKYSEGMTCGDVGRE